jgi:hypothetical protein
MHRSRDPAFWVSLFLILCTVFVSAATYYRWIDVRFHIGPYFFTHWLSWIGTLFIALFTPLYYVLKRRIPRLVQRLVPIHMYGNLLSFLLISTHFFQQVGRPPQFYPDLGTGVALYAVGILLVASGFIHRFQLLGSVVPHQNRFLHVSVTSAFYIIIIVHILQGIGLI